MSAKNCTTHHYACECREAKFAALERENAALRAALTPWLAWEDAGGEIPSNAARELLRIARIALEKHRKEPR